MSAHFGPGGNALGFSKAGYKSSVFAPKYVRELGLNAYEYEAGNGLAASPDTLEKIGKAALEHDISMSLHSQYFISLSSVELEKRLKSVKYITDCVAAASLLGAKTIVIHAGSASKISREEAVNLAKDTLLRTLEAVEPYLCGIKLGIETMGKENQLGTIDEVLDICSISSHLAPVIDFGHCYARSHGEIFTELDDYLFLFDKIEKKLSVETLEGLHCHFSKIEYTSGGEKRHLTFESELFGPSPEAFVKAIKKSGISPNVICESAGTQDIDSLYMKNLYESL